MSGLPITRRALRDAATNRMLPLAGCVAILLLARPLGMPLVPAGHRGTAVAIGFLLVTAWIVGKAAARAGLPRITGYLLTGIAIGPYGTGMLTADMLVARKAIDGVAVAVIAITAGGELRLDWLRRHIGALATITAFELTCVLLMVWAGFVAVQSAMGVVPPDWMPEGTAGLVIVGLVLASVAVANSPAVAIAVINETRSAGPLSRTVMGVTIIKDIAVIVLFAISLALARNVLGGDATEALWWTLSRELLGSVLVGVVFGWLVVWYLRHIDREVPVFVLVLCLVMAQVCSALHVELLLASVAVGFYVQNFSGGLGDRLLEAIERVSLPVYALFFAGAGAKVRLDVLADLWLPALIFVVIRGVAVFLGTRAGAHFAGAEESVRRYAWVGFISQAGVSLALAAVVARTFPDWGPRIEVLFIAMIAVHELIGPPLFQWALGRAGEVGRADE